jgi:rubrerythrin
MYERMRRDGPVGNTTHNLIHTVNEKIDALMRYPVYVEDADIEGCDRCRQLFTRCEQHESEDLKQLLAHLRDHLQHEQGLRTRKAA